MASEKYLEYESTKNNIEKSKKAFAKAILEKERLITKTMPSAINYDKDTVMSSRDDNPLESYVISSETKHLDEIIAKHRQNLSDWSVLLEYQEKELRKSQDKYDIIYTMRCIDCMGINKIARVMNYSKSQVYRILKQIYKRCDKMRK